MKYLLQIYPPAAREELERMPEDERQALVEEYLAIGRSPEVIGGQQLQPIETATTVRVENGETLLTDGPFVDAKEHVGGFCLVQDHLHLGTRQAGWVRRVGTGSAGGEQGQPGQQGERHGRGDETASLQHRVFFILSH